MRYSPTKLLNGLLYTAPVMLLTLAACGGGGGGPGSTFVPAYFLGGYVSNLNLDGLTLRNNGGDNLDVASNVTGFEFVTKVVAATNYNITVLTHPSTLSAHQRCSVTNPSGTMPAYDLPASGAANVTVTCVDAYTIGGTISGLTSNGLVLQNKLGDNLLVPANALSYTFSTPLIDTAPYDVTVLTDPNSPSQLCTVTAPSGNVAGGPVSVSISCATDPAPPVDQYAYAANYGSNTVTPYGISPASGILNPGTAVATGNGPSSVAVDSAGQFVYVTNQSANSVSAYSIGVGGALSLLADVDAGTIGDQSSIPTGSTPVAISIHPSGKFAYVVNSTNNSVSAYSIDAAGALARIDSDGSVVGNQSSIPARSSPISIALHPDGGYAYVANAGSNNVSVYSIDSTSGALTAIDADGAYSPSTNTYIAAGTTPYSVSVDPTGLYVYVANGGSGNVSSFTITAGTLAPTAQVIKTAGTGPRSVIVHPSGLLAYVVNGGSNDISAYTINPLTGALADVSGSPFAAGTGPISISIDSSGKYAYVANSGSASVSAYSINTSTGALTQVTGSPFAAGTSPYGVTTAP